LDADHASLGALIRTSTEDNGLGRTKVTTILEESDAFRRGLDQDDEIVSFAGRPISSDNHYKNVVGLFPRGWRVPLEFRRGNEPKKEVLVRLMGVQKKELPDGNPPPKIEPKKIVLKAGPPSPADKYYEPKAGYANYYFNRQEKARVFNAFKKISDFSAAKGAWSFDGEVRLLKARTESKFSVEMKEEMIGKSERPIVSLKIGAFPDTFEPEKLDNTDHDRRKPNGSGGFMAALYVWRHMLTEGEKGFKSDCNHGGMEPFYPPPTDGSAVKRWSDQRVDADVISTTLGVYQTKWFFARSDEKLLGFELRLQELNEDPCEVYFSDYKAVDGKQLPHRMQVYYKDVHYGTFTVTNYKLAAK